MEVSHLIVSPYIRDKWCVLSPSIRNKLCVLSPSINDVLSPLCRTASHLVVSPSIRDKWCALAPFHRRVSYLVVSPSVNDVCYLPSAEQPAILFFPPCNWCVLSPFCRAASHLVLSSSINVVCYIPSVVSWCGLVVRHLAGKQKDLGSIHFSSPFSSLQKCWFMDTVLWLCPRS